MVKTAFYSVEAAEAGMGDWRVFVRSWMLSSSKDFSFRMKAWRELEVVNGVDVVESVCLPSSSMEGGDEKAKTRKNQKMGIETLRS